MECVRAAFKEWAIIVDALGGGDQIVILRKGGISEGRGGFQVDHPEFWLFPTSFHQQGEGVIESARPRFENLKKEFAETSTLSLQFFARVIHWERLNDLAQAQRLAGQ